MNWEQRAKQYIESFGHEFLAVEDGYVYWEDKSGRIFASMESAVNYEMNVWEGKE